MNATYRFTPDARYYFASRGRYEQQRPFLFRPPVGYLLPVFPLLVAWLVLRLTDPELEAAVRSVILLFLIVFALGHIAIQVFLYQRIKNKESKFTEMTFTLSEEGVSVSDALSRGTVAWRAFPRAVRFRDGIMLLRSQFHRIWLPDSALQGLAPEVVTELVQSKIPLRRVA